MSNLWRGVAATAILCGALAACATPQYPISQPAAAPTPAPPPPPPAPPPPPPDPNAGPQAQPAPLPPVDSQPLAPPSPGGAPSAAASGAPAAVAAADPPPAAGDPPPDPPSNATPPAEGPAAAPAPAPEQPLSPMMVVHDQPTQSTAAPPTRETTAAPAPAPAARRYVASVGEARYAIAGAVVAASGDVFENYEVQKGDHIDSIARGFDVSRQAILDANDVKPPYVLHLGQILKVPVAKAYVAQSGDTLSGVARRFSVDESELAQLNHISSRASLRPGEQVGLPSSFHDRGPEKIAGSVTYAAAGPVSHTYAAAPPAQDVASEAPPPSHGYIAGPPQQPPPPRAPITQETPSAPITQERGAGFATQPGAMAPESTGLSDSQIAAAGKGRFVWPVRGDIVAHFGPQGVGRRNDGVDIKAAQGSDVKAAADGEVVYAGDQVPGYGNLVLIKHADGWVTAYAHLDSVAVQMRQQVAQGQTVGAVGMSGGLSEPELHFEVRYAPTPEDKAKPVDPVLVLPGG